MFKTVAQLLVKDGLAVQSKHFNKLIPLGRLDIALEALTFLNPDEICIIDLDGDIERTLNTNLFTLNRINLPVCAGGGATASLMKRFSIERLLKNSSIFSDIYSSPDVSTGRQALIAYMPYRFADDKLFVYHSDLQKFLEKDIKFLCDTLSVYSEIVLLDADGQGVKNGFNNQIFKYIPNELTNRIYLSGGMNYSHINLAKSIGYSGTIIDNTSLYRTWSIDRRFFDAVQPVLEY